MHKRTHGPTRCCMHFPLVEMIMSVMDRVPQQGLSLILVAPRWPVKSWHTKIISLLAGKALAVPSSQGPPLPGGRRGDSPTPGTVATTCLPVERSNLKAQGLPPNVLATIQRARA